MNILAGDREFSVSLVANVTHKEYIEQLLVEESSEPSKLRKGCPDDSFYTVDLGRAIHLYDNWATKLPDVRPFYAVKCNDDPALLKTLAALGTGFDCASKNEIKLVLSLGVDPGRIVYAHTCKQISHLQYATSNGVTMMTFDGEEEVRKIKEHCPHARLLLRVSADDPEGVYPFGNKFGCSVEYGRKLLQLCRQLGLDVIGVCFHVGTMSTNPSAYSSALATCLELFQYGAEVGFQFTVLDIGGGFPGERDSDELFDRMARAVREGLSQHFSPGLYPNLKVIAEPGNYFACSTHVLAVNVIGKRVLENGHGERERKTFMYYVNEGVFGSFNCVISYDIINLPLILGCNGQTKSCHDDKLHPTIIWGQTCDSKDKVCETEMPELRVGDWLYFDNMGGYTISVASTFNGLEIPTKYYYVTESYSARFQQLHQQKNPTQRQP